MPEQNKENKVVIINCKARQEWPVMVGLSTHSLIQNRECDLYKPPDSVFVQKVAPTMSLASKDGEVVGVCTLSHCTNYNGPIRTHGWRR